MQSYVFGCIYPFIKGLASGFVARHVVHWTGRESLGSGLILRTDSSGLKLRGTEQGERVLESEEERRRMSQLSTFRHIPSCLASVANPASTVGIRQGKLFLVWNGLGLL